MYSGISAFRAKIQLWILEPQSKQALFANKKYNLKFRSDGGDRARIAK